MDYSLKPIFHQNGAVHPTPVFCVTQRKIYQHVGIFCVSRRQFLASAMYISFLCVDQRYNRCYNRLAPILPKSPGGYGPLKMMHTFQAGPYSVNYINEPEHSMPLLSQVPPSFKDRLWRWLRHTRLGSLKHEYLSCG